MRKATRSGPPNDPRDAEGWLRFLFEWETEWHSPGGLSYHDFKHRFLLAIVPPGWIKTGYGGIKGKRGNIGRGHVSFVNQYLSGALEKPNQKAFYRLGLEVHSAATGAYLDHLPPSLGSNTAHVGSDGPIISGEVDLKFNNDFNQALRDWRDCVENRTPLFQIVNRLEFMTLVVILEEGDSCYAVNEVRKRIKQKFRCNDLKNLDRTVKSLGISASPLEPQT